MKALVYLIFFIFLFLISCYSGSDEDEFEKPFVELSVSPHSFHFDADGGNSTLSVTSNTNWSIHSSEEWCSPSVQTSRANANIAITTYANPFEDGRSATLTVSAGNVGDIIVSIMQEKFVPAPVQEAYIDPHNTGMSSDAIILAAKMGAGWKPGNSLEAIVGETSWGNPKTTEEMILAIKEAGFNAIHIPCSWNQYLVNQSDYTIKDFRLERVKEVVDYCVDKELYAIANIHWDGGWMENNSTPEKQEEVGEKMAAIWKQVAICFRDYDEHLLFAGANEPNAEDQAEVDVLAAHMQTFVDVVRATGGRNACRNLIVQSPYTDIDRAYDYMVMPTDDVENRLFAEVHYYTPWQFCGLEEDVNRGKMYYFRGKPYHLEGAEDRYPDWDCEEDHLKAQFNKMKTKFVDRGIPMILGEFSAMRRSFPENALWQETHDDSRAYYAETVTREAKNNGMVPFFWDNGDGIIDRNTIAIKDEKSV